MLWLRSSKDSSSSIRGSFMFLSGHSSLCSPCSNISQWRDLLFSLFPTVLCTVLCMDSENPCLLVLRYFLKFLCSMVYSTLFSKIIEILHIMDCFSNFTNLHLIFALCSPFLEDFYSQIFQLSYQASFLVISWTWRYPKLEFSKSLLRIMSIFRLIKIKSYYQFWQQAIEIWNRGKRKLLHFSVGSWQDIKL